jgi:single-strand DNA-binding protein
MNATQLVGRLTKSPRLTITTGDKARANCTLAVDGYNSTTDYIPITCFGRLAENVTEYTDKGHLVAIEGRITSGKYRNDQGETFYTLDIIANNVKFLKHLRQRNQLVRNASRSLCRSHVLRNEQQRCDDCLCVLFMRPTLTITCVITKAPVQQG